MATKKATTKAKAVVKAPEAPKLKCKRCNHVSSFHKGANSQCFVVGCTCTGWTGPKPKKK